MKYGWLICQQGALLRIQQSNEVEMTGHHVEYSLELNSNEENYMLSAHVEVVWTHAHLMSPTIFVDNNKIPTNDSDKYVWTVLQSLATFYIYILEIGVDGGDHFSFHSIMKVSQRDFAEFSCTRKLISYVKKWTAMKTQKKTISHLNLYIFCRCNDDYDNTRPQHLADPNAICSREIGVWASEKNRKYIHEIQNKE